MKCHFTQLKDFLKRTTALDFSVKSRREKYAFIKQTFDHFKYTTLSKKQKGLVKRSIGERKKPEPNGAPGYIRVDSVHQGNKDGQKRIYYSSRKTKCHPRLDRGSIR